MVVQTIEHHPLSAIAKDWTIPDEDVESRKALRQAKRASLTWTSPSSSSANTLSAHPLPPDSSLQEFTLGQHPDEEKGRSIRSRSENVLSFASTTLDSAFEPRLVVAELDDDEEGGWMDAWISDRGIRSEELFSKPNVLSITGPAVFDWNVVLAEAVDTANGNLDLSNRGISFVPETVWELKALRRLPLPPPRTSLPPLFENGASGRRSLARTQSVPTSAPSMFGSDATEATYPAPRSLRSFVRSSTTAAAVAEPVSPRSSALSFSVPIKLNLTHNRLTYSSLSNSLFTLPNLEQLFLGQNQLDRVPAGIGRLSGLVSLSLRSNNIQYLPAEILRLDNLEQITLHPNPFLSPPPQNVATSTLATDQSENAASPAARRLLGPLKVHFGVPSLVETTTRYLLSPSSDPTSSNLCPPLRISQWERPASFPDSLVTPFLSTPFPTSCTSARRERTISSTSTISAWSIASTIDENAPVAEQPFDPLANTCRSPAHQGVEKVFYRPAVERLEWVTEASLLKPSMRKSEGAKRIPILHRGCSRTCLDWLQV